MDPILLAFYKNFKNSFEYDGSNSLVDESKCFELFINYLLFSLDNPEVFIGDEELLDFISVGGFNDTGIDGIGIKINDKLVRSIDDVVRIVQSSRKVEIEFVFIQSKKQSTFDLAEFNTFCIGVKHFFLQQTLVENDKVKASREIKDYIYANEELLLKLQSNPILKLYYATTGIVPFDPSFLNAVSLQQKEIGDGNYFDQVNIHLLGGKELIAYNRDLTNRFDISINVLDIFPLIVKSESGVKKAYAFTCKATELLKILTKDDGGIRKSIFNDNVRDYLGNKGSINSEIESTIINDPEMFLLCNNGITIVCSEFDQVRDKLVRIVNPQVVNGCQTSNSLFNLSSSEYIENIQVLVRLISTEDWNVTNKIVRGTNKQNQVLDEAFEAITPFHQDVLEPYFLAYENKNKIYYERRSKQYSNDPLIKKTHIVNLRILTQTYVGMFLELPHESHRHEAKLLEEYAKDKNTRKIFRDEHSPYPYLVCGYTWFILEKYFREGLIPEIYKPYKAHFCLLLKISLGEYTPSVIKSKLIDKYCQKMMELLSNPSLKYKIDECVRLFEATRSDWIKDNRSQYGIKDSKEFTKLLIEKAKKTFIISGTAFVEDQPKDVEGEILRICHRPTHWFGFVKQGADLPNLYFDARDYDGDISKLYPATKVKYKIINGTRGLIATNVRII